MNYKEKVEDFLAQKIIAVAGVSRNAKEHIGNPIYHKFKTAGYKTYPLNPFADEISGDKCYPNLKSVPEKVEAVFIGTSAKNSIEVVKECAELGISKIWFHRAIGRGNYTIETVKFCEENNIDAIFYGCPMMHLSADPFHKCFHFLLKVTGKLK